MVFSRCRSRRCRVPILIGAAGASALGAGWRGFGLVQPFGGAVSVPPFHILSLFMYMLVTRYLMGRSEPCPKCWVTIWGAGVSPAGGFIARSGKAVGRAGACAVGCCLGCFSGGVAGRLRPSLLVRDA